MKNNHDQSMATNAVITSYSNAQQNTKSNSHTQTTKGNNNHSMQAVIGVFSSRNDAEQAVQTLRNHGFTTEEISIVSKHGAKHNQQTTYEDDITDGALTGGTLGGIGGLIVGAGALAIPGIGPIVAAGPIAAALSGAVAGGIAGGLIDWGIPAETSRRYEQSVAQGNILAIVKTQQSKVQQASQVLRQNGAQDVESHDTK